MKDTSQFGRKGPGEPLHTQQDSLNTRVLDVRKSMLCSLDGIRLAQIASAARVSVLVIHLRREFEALVGGRITHL